MRYGVDVALVRADDLDKRMIAYVEEHSGCSVLDVGCGGGGQAGRLATLGAKVRGIDVIDYEPAFVALRKELNLNDEQLSFVVGDLRSLSQVVGTDFTIGCVQRVLHYLTYEEALAALEQLRQIITERLFISVSGLESDIGDHYAARDKVLKERWGRLDEVGQEKFQITEAVCLYKPEEFIDLLQQAGWAIEECWVSAFGNIKAVVR